jgi:hypothetical protein
MEKKMVINSPKPKITSIPVSIETRAKLQTLMKYGETYDDFIRKLLDLKIASIDKENNNEG